MTKHLSGNGFGKVKVHQQDMGGWVRVFTDPMPAFPDELPVWLSLALTEWFRQRPQLRMRCVTSIAREGEARELHAWYDLQLFPDLSGQHPAQE
jgi:hypothetical protein